jgi:hypothetical protein
MTLLEELVAHKGGLVRIKTQLCWYGGRGWDGVHDRVCLLLNAAVATTAATGTAAAFTEKARIYGLPAAPAALLLVDGAPHWIWVAQADVELLS